MSWTSGGIRSFEEGLQFMLMVVVDDTTGNAVGILFCDYENTVDYFLMVRGLSEPHLILKGRVERAAGAVEERLVAELRLAVATTIEEPDALLK